MKRFILLMLLGCAGLTGYATAQTPSGDTVREQKKVKEEQLDSLLHTEALRAMANQFFVLEADRVVLRNMQTVYVSPGINFVSVKNDKAVVQISFDASEPGLNGVGGITVEGTVSSYKMKQDKKGYTYLNFDVLGASISAKIDIYLMPESNRASVTVYPNLNSNKVTLTGVLKPAEKSNVFKGNSL